MKDRGCLEAIKTVLLTGAVHSSPPSRSIRRCVTFGILTQVKPGFFVFPNPFYARSVAKKMEDEEEFRCHSSLPRCVRSFLLSGLSTFRIEQLYQSAQSNDHWPCRRAPVPFEDQLNKGIKLGLDKFVYQEHNVSIQTGFGQQGKPDFVCLSMVMEYINNPLRTDNSIQFHFDRFDMKDSYQSDTGELLVIFGGDDSMDILPQYREQSGRARKPAEVAVVQFPPSPLWSFHVRFYVVQKETQMERIRLYNDDKTHVYNLKLAWKLDGEVDVRIDRVMRNWANGEVESLLSAKQKRKRAEEEHCWYVSVYVNGQVIFTDNVLPTITNNQLGGTVSGLRQAVKYMCSAAKDKYLDQLVVYPPGTTDFGKEKSYGSDKEGPGDIDTPLKGVELKEPYIVVVK